MGAHRENTAALQKAVLAAMGQPKLSKVERAILAGRHRWPGDHRPAKTQIEITRELGIHQPQVSEAEIHLIERLLDRARKSAARVVEVTRLERGLRELHRGVASLAAEAEVQLDGPNVGQ